MMSCLQLTTAILVHIGLVQFTELSLALSLLLWDGKQDTKYVEEDSWRQLLFTCK